MTMKTIDDLITWLIDQSKFWDEQIKHAPSRSIAEIDAGSRSEKFKREYENRKIL